MKRIDELIQKLYSNSCSRSELEELLNLLSEDTSQQSPQIMQELINRMPDMSDQDKIDFSKIKERIDLQIKVDTTSKRELPNPRQLRSTFFKRALSIAATIFLLISFAWILLQSQQNKQMRKTTRAGEIKKFELPDGSRVTLNANSSLSYLEDWEEGETRIVHLLGEAFFEIEKKPKSGAKFQVSTSGLNVEVLGTSFNVKHRNEATSVFLEEGKVSLQAVENKEEEVFMNPGELVHYSVNEKTLSSPKIVEGRFQTSWKTGILEFEEVPLIEILERLVEINDFQFELEDDSLGQLPLTSSIPAHDVENAMSILTKTSGMKFSIENDIYILQKNDD